MLCPQNGERIVAVDFMTSFHPMHYVTVSLCVRSLFETIQTLYFAVYGLTSVDVFRINEGHELTQFIGKLMFGCYCACMIIVLINMLIAMLSQAYETISVCSHFTILSI